MNNNTPTSDRLHVSFFGRCNSGKSSLINAICGQNVSIVSDIAGTTTDPVLKAIEISGIGATILIDTAGWDDNSELGKMRIDQTKKILDKTDIAIILFNESNDLTIEENWINELNKRNIPHIPVISKADIISDIKTLSDAVTKLTGNIPTIVSPLNNTGIAELKKAISDKSVIEHRLLTNHYCNSGDTVLLVMPQDEQAPKGRIIKPQVEVIRELLDRNCNIMCCTSEGLSSALSSLKTEPQLIITDSQVFNTVYQQKPKESTLTSFSVIFARHKGDIDLFVEGARHIKKLNQSSHILIAEACTHTPQHEDIGRVKLPHLLRKHIGEDVNIDIVGGNDFPDDLSSYDLVIHCGACMFNRQHVLSRINKATKQKIAITNYGIAIAYLTGILDKIKY